jgi:hypothetical protein
MTLDHDHVRTSAADSAVADKDQHPVVPKSASVVTGVSVLESTSGYRDIMDLGSWPLELLVAVGGAAVAIYGAVVLLTGHATLRDRRAFGRTKDVGLYYLCLGLALTLLMLGVLWNEHHQSLLAVVALIGVMTLTGLVIHYRPRRDKQR